MAAFVVDTNVPVVANGKSHADPGCVIACLDALSGVRSNGIIVLDDAMQILHEYMKNLSLAGEPGAGDAFMKWVWSVQADENHCEQVSLTPRYGHGADDFEEFPDDPGLAAFDRSDRKFVAAARASVKDPIILNAVDSDWAESHAALERSGLTVRFLCPQHVRP
jgi:hypothetical protein